MARFINVARGGAAVALSAELGEDCLGDGAVEEGDDGKMAQDLEARHLNSARSFLLPCLHLHTDGGESNAGFEAGEVGAGLGEVAGLVAEG